MNEIKVNDVVIITGREGMRKKIIGRFGVVTKVENDEYTVLLAKGLNGYGFVNYILSKNDIVKIGESYLDFAEKEECNCDFSKDGKCIHFLSQGELTCNGSDKEKSECVCFGELE